MHNLALVPPRVPFKFADATKYGVPRIDMFANLKEH